MTAKLARELAEVQRPDGQPLKPDVKVPSEIYRQVRGDAPDLMIYFGDLRWRSAGTIGYHGLFLEENDTGPDDSVHSFDGIFAVRSSGTADGAHLAPQVGIDIGPTILKRMGIEPAPNVKGKPIPELL